MPPDKRNGPAATPDRSQSDSITDNSTVAGDSDNAGEVLDATGLLDCGEQ
jgi:hypothetical protein